MSARSGRSSGSGPTIKFDEENIQSHPAGTVFVDHDEEEHSQDWTKTTHEKETWANKERRRSSIFAKTDPNAPHLSTSPTKTAAPRRGSILSVWSSGKDKDGKSILKHDDHELADDERVVGSIEVPVVEKVGNKRSMSGSSSNGADRRGSILSLWGKGTDEHGRSVVLHDDEEWNDEAVPTKIPEEH